MSLLCCTLERTRSLSFNLKERVRSQFSLTFQWRDSRWSSSSWCSSCPWCVLSCSRCLLLAARSAITRPRSTPSSPPLRSPRLPSPTHPTPNPSSGSFPHHRRGALAGRRRCCRWWLSCDCPALITEPFLATAENVFSRLIACSQSLPAGASHRDRHSRRRRSTAVCFLRVGPADDGFDGGGWVFFFFFFFFLLIVLCPGRCGVGRGVFAI